ncbi:hypothetical protein ACFW04_003090 [Cataglyphis niger]
MEIGETRNRAITAEEHRHADTEYHFRNNNAVRIKPYDRECTHSSGSIIQLERSTYVTNKRFRNTCYLGRWKKYGKPHPWRTCNGGDEKARVNWWCVRRCSHGHELACERAQGLNFNYFLFGRYNISMLGGAWPTGRARLSPPSLSSNVIIIIRVCAWSVISCARPSPDYPLATLSTIPPLPPRTRRILCVRLSPLSRRLRLTTLSRAPLFSLASRLACVPTALGIVQLKCRNCPSEFILKFVPNQSTRHVDVHLP